jgi:hypothetical protein
MKDAFPPVSKMINMVRIVRRQGFEQVDTREINFISVVYHNKTHARKAKNPLGRQKHLMFYISSLHLVGCQIATLASGNEEQLHALFVMHLTGSQAFYTPFSCE